MILKVGFDPHGVGLYSNFLLRLDIQPEQCSCQRFDTSLS